MVGLGNLHGSASQSALDGLYRVHGWTFRLAWLDFPKCIGWKFESQTMQVGEAIRGGVMRHKALSKKCRGVFSEV